MLSAIFFSLNARSICYGLVVGWQSYFHKVFLTIHKWNMFANTCLKRQGFLLSSGFMATPSSLILARKQASSFYKNGGRKQANRNLTTKSSWLYQNGVAKTTPETISTKKIRKGNICTTPKPERSSTMIWMRLRKYFSLPNLFCRYSLRSCLCTPF